MIDFTKIQKAVNGLNEIAKKEGDEYGEVCAALAGVLWRGDYLGISNDVTQRLLEIAEDVIEEYIEDNLNPDTGLTWGDHGTAQQALHWIMHVADDTDPYNTLDFLKCWEEGDLTDWPEYYTWLKDNG